jgi:hypothetical protein
MNLLAELFNNDNAIATLVVSLKSAEYTMISVCIENS